jgi:hypothetical protein
VKRGSDGAGLYVGSALQDERRGIYPSIQLHRSNPRDASGDVGILRAQNARKKLSQLGTEPQSFSQSAMSPRRLLQHREISTFE